MDCFRARQGGWFVCNSLRAQDQCTVYSLGVNDDWSFDKEMSDGYGCEVHGFDPSPEGLASMKAYTEGSTLRKYVALSVINI